MTRGGWQVADFDEVDSGRDRAVKKKRGDASARRGGRIGDRCPWIGTWSCRTMVHASLGQGEPHMLPLDMDDALRPLGSREEGKQEEWRCPRPGEARVRI